MAPLVTGSEGQPRPLLPPRSAPYDCRDRHAGIPPEAYSPPGALMRTPDGVEYILVADPDPFYGERLRAAGALLVEWRREDEAKERAAAEEREAA